MSLEMDHTHARTRAQSLGRITKEKSVWSEWLLEDINQSMMMEKIKNEEETAESIKTKEGGNDEKKEEKK